MPAPDPTFLMAAEEFAPSAPPLFFANQDRCLNRMEPVSLAPDAFADQNGPNHFGTVTSSESAPDESALL